MNLIPIRQALPFLLLLTVAACGTDDSGHSEPDADTSPTMDTGSEDTVDTDTAPAMDTAPEDVEDVEPDTEQEPDVEPEDPALVAYLAWCEAYAAQDCRMLYDPSCDGIESVEEYRLLWESMAGRLGVDVCPDFLEGTWCGEYESSVSRGWIAFDMTETWSCHATLGELTCADYFAMLSPEAERVCEPSTEGLQERGEPCNLSQDCQDEDYCIGGLYHSQPDGSFVHDEGECAPRLALGERCDRDRDCEEGLVCPYEHGAVCGAPE